MDLLGRLGNRPICWPRTRTTRLPYRITMEHPFFTNSRSVSASDNHFYFNRLWSTVHRRSVCACRPKQQSRGTASSPLLSPVASRESAVFRWCTSSSIERVGETLPDRSTRRLVSRGFLLNFFVRLLCGGACEDRRMPLIHHHRPGLLKAIVAKTRRSILVPSIFEEKNFASPFFSPIFSLPLCLEEIETRILRFFFLEFFARYINEIVEEN